jgi:hypothetical protein
MKERGGKSTFNCFLPSFIHSFSGPHPGLCHQGQRPKTVDATVLTILEFAVGNNVSHELLVFLKQKKNAVPYDTTQIANSLMSCSKCAVS